MSIKRIGIWQTAFLGDAILTLPLLQTLARSFPDAKIYFFVRKGFKSLFEADLRYKTIEFDKYDRDKGLSGIFKISSQIRKLGFDLWLSPHTSLRSAAVSFFSNAATSIGYNTHLHNMFAYTHTVSRRFSQLNEIERILELLTPLKIKSRQTWPAIVLPGEARQKADIFWKKNVRKRTLGIHPGSTWPTKKWPEKYFARIISMVQELNDTQVIIFAGPGEESIVRDIKARLNSTEYVMDLSGKLNLPELAAYLAKLDCYLTSDSGPMHLAWPQNVPTIALFGPTTKQLGFFPRGRNATVLETDLSCRPCGLHGHKSCPEKHHKCMRDILPETVLSTIKEKLHA